MHRYLMIGILMVFVPELSMSQNSNVWRFGSYIEGRGAELTFVGGQVSVTTVSNPMSLYITNASISDGSGALQFYTNGIDVANRLGQPMLNGNDLGPGVYTNNYAGIGLPIDQGAIIIPVPDSQNEHYIFHKNLDIPYPGSLFPSKLFYSRVDMSLDGGLGGIIPTEKNVSIYDGQLTLGKLSAVKHANGRDWWLMAQESNQLNNSNNYLTFLIDPSGISGPNTQAIGTSDFHGWHNLVFSNNGDFIISSITENWSIDYMEFDRCSGELEWIENILLDSMGIYSVAISPNNRFLYYSNYTLLYQLDLEASDIASTRTLIGIDTSMDQGTPDRFGKLVLGPDNKIYLSTYNGSRYIHVINNPDEAGSACEFVQQQIFLGDTSSMFYGMPNFPNYQLGPVPESVCDSLNLAHTTIPIQKPVLYNVGPNPTTGTIRISSRESDEFSIKLYDCLGDEKMVSKTTKSNGVVLNLSNQVPGTYQLVLTNSNGQSQSQSVVFIPIK